MFVLCYLTALVDTDLAMHSVQLVVEGHGEIGRGAGGYMCYKGGLALIDCIVHVHPTLANLHVLEAGFNTATTSQKTLGQRFIHNPFN